MALWRRLLQGSEWAYLADVLSPDLFEVISRRQLSASARTLARHWFDRDGAKQLCGELDEATRRAGGTVRLRNEPAVLLPIPFVGGASSWGRGAPASDGNALLEFFFFQLYANQAAFLDLRLHRFCRGDEGTVVFWPLPLWTRWQPDFIEALRRLYKGFYGGSHEAYEEALRELGAAPAVDVFERAFGGSTRQACQFSVAGLERTFHEVFVRCRAHKAPLHPDFVGLGIALLTLHDHLESLGGTYDVAACWRRAFDHAERLFGAEPPTGIAIDPLNG